MSKTITLKISDNIYELLVRASEQSGQTPEQVVQEWVKSKAEQSVHDPLLQLAGAFESDISDISKEHDVYLGKALLANDA